MQFLREADFRAQIKCVVAGEAVGAQANVDAELPEPIQVKLAVIKIGAAFGAMDDREFSRGERLEIVILQVVHVNEQAVFGQEPELEEMGEGRAVAAVGIV